MSATKTFFRSASPGEQGQFARRAADSQAGHVVDADREGIISFPALGPGSHLQGSAFPRTGPSAADVLPLTQDPVNLPLDELSAAAITALLRSAASAGHQAACLWFRTGKYGVIEEIHGHAAGLKLMKHIEARLGECLREDDVLCRVTDNEFVIVLYGIEDMTHVASVADRVLAHCGGIYDTGDLRLHVRASIGIAMYPADAAQPHDLLRFARMALRDVNQQHPAQYRMFSPALLTRLRDRAWTVTELQRALEQDRLVLHYQPQYAIDTQRIVGVEALVRLVTESGELLGPDHFIDLAEHTGQIHQLGRWVIEQACQQLGRWRKAGGPRLRMAVNICPAQLMATDFCTSVDAAVSRAGIEHSDLELEITERQMVEHLPRVEQTLRALMARGVRVAIDDFGTGYSSLACLMQLSIHAVKVDRGFMAQIPENGRAGRIVALIIDMARELELDLTAEGIETDAQHRFLLESGCAFGQGYNFARPQSAEAIERLLL
jgi:diguanylate cyclase (GGDEF)-like protein